MSVVWSDHYRRYVTTEPREGTLTGDVGVCAEYTADGRRTAMGDSMTMDELVAASAAWPETYWCYRGPHGYAGWAHAGHRIDESQLPEATRDAECRRMAR